MSDHDRKKDKVCIIGLDGATWEIIEPMVQKGKLPNLARIMKTGAYGPLRSTLPPVTPCAWTSMVTGKDPSKHGLFDFHIHEGDPEKPKSINSTRVRAQSIWHLLGERGKRSIVIDVPLTYPPSEIDGIMISRVMAPPKKNCAYPKSLYYTLRRKGYIKIPDQKLADQHGAADANREQREKKQPRKKVSKAQLKKMARERVEKAFSHMKEEIDKNVALVDWLLKKEEWDLCMVVFMSADHAGHTFWRYQGKVKKIYEKLDSAIGRLLKITGEHVVTMIASDHGFTSLPYSFNINEWLYERNLLAKKLDIPGKESMNELKAFLRNTRAEKKEKSKKPQRLEKFRFQIRTDYARSRVYLQSGTSYGIRINLKGRDVTGIVEPHEYEPFRDYLIRELSELINPYTGEKVFSDIIKKEDAYSPSPFGADPAPDLFLLTRNMDTMVQGQFTQQAKVFKKTSRGYGFHHPDGILLATGQSVRRVSFRAHITDVAATALHVLGIPLPEDLDGRVRKEIFTPDSEYATRTLPRQAPSVRESKEKRYTKKEEEKVKAELAALGYMS